MDRLKGKIALVVGAGSIGPGWGNGKATAVTFAREGAQVFCVDRNAAAAEETVKIIAGEGGKAAAFTADVSRTAAVEFASKHVRVNAILPGLMKTPMVEHSAGLAASYAKGDVAAMWRARDAQVPMGHMGEAWDVANAALFLASDEAKYITGIELVVDGGITCKAGQHSLLMVRRRSCAVST